jgi:hypothetical protein
MEVLLVPCLLAVTGGAQMGQCNPTPFSLVLRRPDTTLHPTHKPKPTKKKKSKPEVRLFSHMVSYVVYT